ncbi:MAG: hypothetical protein O3A54_05005, partial [Actinobacteria bacterium]|nr:hypothetical protein [Actinomycetota bacterium]
YKSVLEDPKSIQVVGANNDSNSAVLFLGQSISNKPLIVPVGFLNILVTGGDSRLDMKRLVWWPKSFVEINDELSPDDSELRVSDLVKPWEQYGTHFAMSLQVNWSEPFAYEDFTVAKTKSSEHPTAVVENQSL